MSIKKFTFAFAAVSILALSVTSCSPNSIADEDSLYIEKQGIEKNRIKIQPQG